MEWNVIYKQESKSGASICVIEVSNGFLPVDLKKDTRNERTSIPEISPQIHNLPRPQPDQHPHGAKREPFDPLIRALVRIPQLLLPGAEVVHLGHNLADELLDAPQLRLDRFQLLRRLNGRPVAGVGADVDVEFDVAGGASSS